ncbi:MAG: hypothetical protein JRF31_13110 [Deltaproteobacteria bacterium]|nr:hypothetical protein [Deltaproteobacteria bacterium]
MTALRLANSLSVMAAMTRSRLSGDILYVSGSISTKIGRAPVRNMDPAVAKKVYGVVITVC